MSEGSGKLAAALAEAIVEKMGFNGEKDMNIYLDIILTAMQRIEKNVIDNNVSWLALAENEIKKQFDELREQNILLSKAEQKYLETFIIQFAKLCTIAAVGGSSGGNSSNTTNTQSGETSPSDLAEETMDATDEIEGGGYSAKGGRNSIQKSIGRIETKQDKLIHSVNGLKRENLNLRTDIEDSEARAHKRSIRMERSIKRTIKSRMGKLWSLFKKTLIIGLLLFFRPMLKNMFTKLGEWLSPVGDWFKETFPSLYGYIKDLSAYVGSLASDFKFLVDKIQAVLDWTEENSTLIKGIEGAIAGAGMGALAGSIIPGLGNLAGGILGGLIGFGVGAGADILKKHYEYEMSDAGQLEKNQRAYEKGTFRNDAVKEVNAMIDNGVIPEEEREYAVEKMLEWYKAIDDWAITGGEGTIVPKFEIFYRQKKEAENQNITNGVVAINGGSSGGADTPTAADVLESGLDGQTTVETPEETSSNSIAYQVYQQSTTNNYFVPPSDNLWNVG